MNVAELTIVWSAFVLAAPAQNQSSRFIPPEANVVIGEALDELAPAWEWESASVKNDRVEGSACEPGGAQCYPFVLTDPQSACSGQVTGPWCLLFQGEVPAELVDAMDSVLSPMPADKVWYAPDGSEQKIATPVVERTRDPDLPPPFFRRYLLPWLLGLGLLVLPALAGLVFTIGLRRQFGRRLGSIPVVTALLLTPPVLVCLLPSYLFGVGFWDLLLAGFALGGGMAGAALYSPTSVGRRTVLLAVAAVFVGLVVLEAGSRLLPPVPYSFYPPWKVTLRLPAVDGVPPYPTVQTDALYPDEDPEFMVVRTSEAKGAHKTVLHVGDSMVHGTTLERRRTFPALMSEMDGLTAHLNAGVPGTGPDYYYQLVLNWLEHIQVELVVLHLFAGGDLTDMDRSYAFCNNGPLLEYLRDGPQPLCPSPTPGKLDTLSRWQSPPPYLLRLAAGSSAAARHLCALFYRFPGLWNHRLQGKKQAEHLEQILTALAARLSQRGIGLLVVVLPHRRALEDGSEERRRRSTELVEIANRAGVTALDAYPPLAAGAKDLGTDLFLPDVPGDIHFSAEGHRLLARWMLHQLHEMEGALGPPQTSQPRRQPD